MVDVDAPTNPERWPCASAQASVTEVSMKRFFFEAISVVLLGGSIVFFHQTVTFLSRRDYIASLILLLIGLSVMRVGSEMARLALVDRR